MASSVIMTFWSGKVARLISRATLPDQKVIITELANAAMIASESKIKSPVIIVIGEVIHLRDQLNWLGLVPVNS